MTSPLRIVRGLLRHRPGPAQIRKAWQTWLSGRDKLAARDQVRARPLRIHFEINDYCNLKCIMCSRESAWIPKNTGAIPLESVKRLAPYLRTASYVGIAGNGEPFMHRELMDVLEFICAQGCVPSTITNCTLLTQDRCDRLARMGPSLLMASIDGGSKEVFETIRLGATFEKIVENMERLRDTKKRLGTPYPVINFITCLMKENIDDLENVARLAHRVGAAEVNVQNLFPYHDGAWDHVFADFDAIDRRIVDMRALARELGVRINYNPVGFNIERRLEHAAAVGRADAPTSGLQLNGRERESKTVGKVLALAGAGAGGNGGGRPVALLEAPSTHIADLHEAFAPELEAVGPDESDTNIGDHPIELSGGIFDADYKAPRRRKQVARGSDKPWLRLMGHGPDGAAPAATPAAGGAPEEPPPPSPETHKVVVATPKPNEAEGEPKYYCQNVFQQFHINTKGEARICCFWTQGSLGNIADTSVEEMWNSAQFRGVRRAILKGNLPLDCKTCHQLVPYDKKAIREDTLLEIKECLKR